MLRHDLARFDIIDVQSSFVKNKRVGNKRSSWLNAGENNGMGWDS